MYFNIFKIISKYCLRKICFTNNKNYLTIVLGQNLKEKSTDIKNNRRENSTKNREKEYEF